MKASIKTKPYKKRLELDVIVELYVTDNYRPRKKIGTTLPEHWDKITKEPNRLHPFFASFYRTIKDYQNRIADINYSNYTVAQAEKILFGVVSVLGSDFITFFDVYATEKKAVGESTRLITEVKKQLINFAGDNVPFDAITYEWLNKFVHYKLASGTGMAGIMTYLRTMRAVYKEAQRRQSLNVPAGNPFIGVIKSTPPAIRPEITEEHLRALAGFQKAKYTTSNNYAIQKRNIDLFFFQFYMGGHDFVDIAKMRWKDIAGGRIVIDRYKNRNKPRKEIANNIILPEAFEIIDRHGTPENDRIFGFIPNPVENMEKYRNYRSTVNKSLASISTTLQIPPITTKTPRYIFRTRAGNLLIHDIVVAKIMAHKLEGITYRYQGTISPEIQDNAHRQIVKL